MTFTSSALNDDPLYQEKLESCRKKMDEGQDLSEALHETGPMKIRLQAGHDAHQGQDHGQQDQAHYNGQDDHQRGSKYLDIPSVKYGSFLRP